MKILNIRYHWCLKMIWRFIFYRYIRNEQKKKQWAQCKCKRKIINAWEYNTNKRGNRMKYFCVTVTKIINGKDKKVDNIWKFNSSSCRFFTINTSCHLAPLCRGAEKNFQSGQCRPTCPPPIDVTKTPESRKTWRVSSKVTTR